MCFAKGAARRFPSKVTLGLPPAIWLTITIKMEHDDIKNKIAAIVATAPDLIGAVALWPHHDGETAMLGALLDTRMGLIHGSTTWNSSQNLFVILDSLQRSAAALKRNHETDEENDAIERAAREAQIYNGVCASERI